MFLSRKTFDDLNLERIKAHEECRALALVNTQLQAHLEWLRVRTTQLEFERSQLIKKYMNVDLPVPSFEDAPPQHPDMNQVNNFSDIGDKAAAALGIGWNLDGTLSFAEKT